MRGKMSGFYRGFCCCHFVKSKKSSNWSKFLVKLTNTIIKNKTRQDFFPRDNDIRIPIFITATSLIILTVIAVLGKSSYISYIFSWMLTNCFVIRDFCGQDVLFRWSCRCDPLPGWQVDPSWGVRSTGFHLSATKTQWTWMDNDDDIEYEEVAERVARPYFLTQTWVTNTSLMSQKFRYSFKWHQNPSWEALLPDRHCALNCKIQQMIFLQRRRSRPSITPRPSPRPSAAEIHRWMVEVQVVKGFP